MCNRSYLILMEENWTFSLYEARAKSAQRNFYIAFHRRTVCRLNAVDVNAQHFYMETYKNNDLCNFIVLHTVWLSSWWFEWMLSLALKFHFITLNWTHWNAQTLAIVADYAATRFVLGNCYKWCNKLTISMSVRSHFFKSSEERSFLLFLDLIYLVLSPLVSFSRCKLMIFQETHRNSENTEI